MKLQQLIEQYITFQQSLGVKFHSNAFVLRAFGRAVGAKTDVINVRAKQVAAFLAGAGPITRTWHTKLSIVRTFYRYAVSRGYVVTAPLPTVIPKLPPRFVPYIYSHEELRGLLHAADVDQRRGTCLEPVTMHTILLLLYGTGLRRNEAANLNRGDVDLVGSLLKIRQTKFGKSRLVPFGSTLTPVLTRYAARARVAGADAPFFTTRTGGRVKPDTLHHTFRFLCKQAGISRSDGGRLQTRLHDLRHTFAVHRVTSWYQQGADVQKLLPLLSVYLGHVKLGDTQVYLTMTPELLHEAGKRFEHYTQKGTTP